MATAPVNPAFRSLRDGLQSIVDELAQSSEAPGASRVRVELERPRDERHGDFATNVALMLAPVVSRSPREVAEEIAGKATTLDGVERVDVAGPGFINVTLTDAWFDDTVRRALDAGATWGANVAEKPCPIHLEFVSANPTGPLVAASARHAAYGDSLARVLRHVGHDVHTEYYVNDAGRQVDLFGASIKARALGEAPPEGGYEGEYVVGLSADLSAGAADDPAELGQRGVAKMMDGMRESLTSLGVVFDRFQSEAELRDAGAVDEGLRSLAESGFSFEEDGAVFLRATAFGDDKDRVLVRANGAPTYFASDIAYLQSKFARVGEDGHLIYVLGADHHGYIARLQAASSALGHPDGACEVAILQMVTLSERGEQKRMSKRRGEFVTASELVQRIGSDATRYWMLQRSHDQQLEIDLDLAEQSDDSNPVYYVQYAHARLCSIRRKVEDEGAIDAASLADSAGAGLEPLHASEKRLIKRIADFPGVVGEAASRRQPHRLVHYAQELASDSNKYYRDCRVLGDGITPELTAQRLRTCDAARSVLALVLDLVGVSAPERM